MGEDQVAIKVHPPVTGSVADDFSGLALVDSPDEGGPPKGEAGKISFYAVFDLHDISSDCGIAALILKRLRRHDRPP